MIKVIKNSFDGNNSNLSKLNKSLYTRHFVKLLSSKPLLRKFFLSLIGVIINGFELNENQRS